MIMTVQKTRTARQGRDEVECLFAEYQRTHDPELRNRLVVAHLHLVRLLAAKFTRRSDLLEDLIQVGSIGLIHAVERFDPERGVRFSTYATPTIVGEIKRYFRDTTWTLKAPRALQELNAQIMRANESLAQQLGRSPTIPEIAAQLEVAEETVIEAMELGNSYEMLSLDGPVEIEGGDTLMTLQDEMGALDPELQKVERYDALRGAVDRLDSQGKTIIYLRFFQELSQAEVAQRLHISQMHVSRLQRKALLRLRGLLTEAAEGEPGADG